MKPKSQIENEWRAWVHVISVRDSFDKKQAGELGDVISKEVRLLCKYSKAPEEVQARIEKYDKMKEIITGLDDPWFNYRIEFLKWIFI